MNQLWTQLRGLWTRLEVAQRATIVLVLVGLIAIAGMVTYGATRPDMRTLVRDLDQATVADVVAHLQERNIAYEVVDHGTAILVPQQHQYSLRKQLAEQNLLGDTSTGFELLAESSFADSTFREQKNYDRAVAGELERSFRTIDGVQSARVIVVRPTPSPFLIDDQAAATASVFLNMEGGQRLQDRQVQGVVRLAAGAVEGLSPDKVEVVDGHGPLTADEPNSAAARASTTLQAQRERERHMMQKAQQLLDRVLGPGRSMVTVALDLDFTQTSEASTDPTTSVVLRETTRTSDESTPQPVVGGLAGTAGNVEGDPVPASGGGESATKTTEDVLREFVVGQKTVTRESAVGGIAGMTVSILLDYQPREEPLLDADGNPVLDADGEPVLTTTWAEMDAAERQRFQDMVLGAIGYDAAKHILLSQYPEQPDFVESRFTVATHSMRMYQPVEEEAAVAGLLPLDTQDLDTYLRYGAAIVAALGLLLVARGQLRRSHQAWQAEQERRRREETERGRREADGQSTREAVMERRMGTKEAIRDQIMENPNVAGQVLRRWMYE